MTDSSSQKKKRSLLNLIPQFLITFDEMLKSVVNYRNMYINKKNEYYINR